MKYVFRIIYISNDTTPILVRSKVFSFVGSMFRPAIDCVETSSSNSSLLSYKMPFEVPAVLFDVMTGVGA
jgi:hypothetical protein